MRVPARRTPRFAFRCGGPMPRLLAGKIENAASTARARLILIGRRIVVGRRVIVGRRIGRRRSGGANRDTRRRTDGHAGRDPATPVIAATAISGSAVIAATDGGVAVRTTDCAATIGTAYRGGAARTTNRGATHRSSIGSAAIGAANRSPAEGVRGGSRRQKGAEDEDCRPVHGLLPAALAG